MESVKSKLGYYPQCPHCPSEEGFDVTPCPDTLGSNGFYELVSCKECHKLVQAVPLGTPQQVS